MQVNGPDGWKLAKKKSLAVSVASMAIYSPTPGFKGRTFKLCVLTRWDFNICVLSPPLRRMHRIHGKISRSENRETTDRIKVDFMSRGRSIDICFIMPGQCVGQSRGKHVTTTANTTSRASEELGVNREHR